MPFTGRTAIVTGAAHGIGEATARRFANDGANVVCVDIHPRGAEVASAIDSAGRGSAIFCQTDISNAAQVEASVDRALQRYGRLDVLVNNGAITLPKGFEQTDQREWDHVRGVNLDSVFLYLRACSPALRESGRGAVVNVASFHASATIENFGAYAASKAGVVGLSRSAALDLAKDGIRVNAVCPGIIQTAMWDAWLAEVDDPDATVQEVLGLQPLGRVGKPEEVANAIAFLASDEASYVTGTTLYVDGGVTARLHHV